MRTGLIALVAAACSGRAAAQPDYEFLRLDSGDMLATHAWDITNSGMVVGSGVDRAGFERGVLWTDAGMRVLPTPAGFDNVRLVGGNNHGAAVGWLENADTGFQAGLWTGDAWTVIEPWEGFDHAWLESVNDAGVAVGIMDPAFGGPTPIRVVNGVASELPTLPHWQGARPLRELDDGTIIGIAGIAQYTVSVVRWVDGQPEEVQPPAGVGAFGLSGSGWGGHVAMFDASENTGSWVWDGSEWFKPDGIVEHSGYIQGFNRAGDFVANNSIRSEALLGLGGDLYLVEDLVDLPDDARSVYFVSINDAGAAAGFTHTRSTTWATVLRPVPAPATLALLGAGGLLASRRRRVAVAAAGAALCAASATAGPPRYFLDIIQPTSAGWCNALADDGSVVGTFDGAPAVWREGIVEPLACPEGADSCSAMHISAAGVAGYAVFGYDRRVVLWAGGPPSVLEVFGDWAWPLGIGEAGHVVGWGMYPPPDNTGSHPFVWYAGVAIDIGTLGRQGGKTNGVNTLGHAVGEFWTRGVVTHAFFWSGENGMIDLGVLPDWAHSKALAVNDSDMVVGECSSFNSLISTPFIWREGVMSPLPILRETGTALAINNDGVIVGHNETEGVGQIGVVWMDGQPFAAEGRLAGDVPWSITECRDINRAGTILAAGRLDGQPYQLLLTPACPGDFNLDRAVDTRDVVAFLGAWAAGESGADFDDNGVLDTRDVAAFLGAWAGGCA